MTGRSPDTSQMRASPVRAATACDRAAAPRWSTHRLAPRPRTPWRPTVGGGAVKIIRVHDAEWAGNRVARREHRMDRPPRLHARRCRRPRTRAGRDSCPGRRARPRDRAQAGVSAAIAPSMSGRMTNTRANPRAAREDSPSPEGARRPGHAVELYYCCRVAIPCRRPSRATSGSTL